MAYLSTIDFFADKSFLDRWQRNLKGELDLGWLQAKTEKLAIRAENPRRGLTFRDLDKGGYGFSALPDLVRQNRSFAPRGAELPPGCRTCSRPSITRGRCGPTTLRATTKRR